MIASTSSAWPLPSTPAMPRTSPRWIVNEMSESTSRTTPSVSTAVSWRPSRSSIGSSVTVDSRVSGEGSSLPTISSARLLGRGGRRVGGADRRTAPDDGDLVGDGEHLAQLVRDEDDGQALGLEAAQVVEERVDLLRDQDRGRLVEDEGAGAAVEDLEDLHALAVGDPEVLDEGVGADAETVRVRDLPDLVTGLGADAVQLLAAENHVLQDREVVGEHEVLVHHADATGDGVGGAGEDGLFAVDGDGALVRLLHAVEDLHQGRFTGTVLTAQGVHGALADGDVDVAVGYDTGESFGDAAQFDGGRAGRVDDALSSEKERWGRRGPGGGGGAVTLTRQLHATRVELTHRYGPGGETAIPRAGPT